MLTVSAQQWPWSASGAPERASDPSCAASRTQLFISSVAIDRERAKSYVCIIYSSTRAAFYDIILKSYL